MVQYKRFAQGLYYLASAFINRYSLSDTNLGRDSIQKLKKEKLTR